MDAFEEHIGSQQAEIFTQIDHRRVVAYAPDSIWQCGTYAFIYSLNQPEFTQAAYFSSCFHAAKLGKKSEAIPALEMASKMICKIGFTLTG